MPKEEYIIFCDESGDCSFSATSKSTFFLIAALTIKKENEQKLIKVLQRKYAKLFKLGWPRNKEFKASVLHSLKWQKDIPQKIKDNVNGDNIIRKILTALVLSEIIESIDFFIVKKEGLTSPTIRNAPYGIAYNFFASKLLPELIIKHNKSQLIMDQRSKETHGKQCFDEYIATQITSLTLKSTENITIDIEHSESHSVYGLQAADFISWSLFRAFEQKDNSFMNIFITKLGKAVRWYI